MDNFLNGYLKLMDLLARLFCAKYTSLTISLVSVILAFVSFNYFREFWLSFVQLAIGFVLAFQAFLIRKQTEEKLKKVNKRIDDLGMSYIDSDEYLSAMLDAEGHFLFGITAEGHVDWALGVPKPIRKELDKIIKMVNSHEK